MRDLMRPLALTVLLTLSSQATAFSDPFNNYQWNKKNHELKNGQVDQGPWFEWWYYKVVIPESNKAYYFVYGVVNPWDLSRITPASRSYVGFGDFSRRTIAEEQFSPGDLEALYDQTSVRLPGAVATGEGFSGTLHSAAGTHHWDVQIQHQWTFNAEGWLLGTGLTDIEWYPAQAAARCSGVIQTQGETIRFANAPCYQDRNWGKRFPEWWAWIVANQFTGSPDTALTIGGGRPHLFGIPSPYEGVCIGLRHQGQDYTFRPMDLDQVKVDINFGKWEVSGVDRQRRTKIEVTAHAPPEAFMDLQFMTPDGVVFHDYEALLGELTVRLYTREPLEDWTLKETLHSVHAGIEFGSTNEYLVKTLFNRSLSLQ